MGKVWLASKFVVFNQDRSALLLMEKKLSDGGLYYEPGGGRLEVDFESKKAESLEQCCVREAREELGLSVEIVGYLGSYPFFWDRSEACSVCGLFEVALCDDVAEFEVIHSQDDCGDVVFRWVQISDLGQKVHWSPNLRGVGELIQHYLN